MKLILHLLVSVLLVAVLYPFFGMYALLVLVTGFLIDVDHYAYYVFKLRKLNPLKANTLFENAKKHNMNNILCVFHTIEVFAFVTILALFTLEGRMLFIGLASHQLMDVYNEVKLDHKDAKAKSIIWHMLGK